MKLNRNEMKPSSSYVQEQWATPVISPTVPDIDFKNNLTLIRQQCLKISSTDDVKNVKVS
jgi:hypothetical protein